MNLDQLLKELAKLNLPIDQYVVVSSGSLAARGIRDARDLDLLVSDKLWNKLAQKYPIRIEHFETIDVGNIQILGKGSTYKNEDIASFDEIFESADIIDNIRFINLSLLKKFKKKLGRDKDLKDIKLIDQYLVKQDQN